MAWWWLACVAACVPPPGEDEPELHTAESELYGARDWKWPGSRIFVCWIQPHPAHQRERAWVRSALRNSWEAHSNVRFVGWLDCANTVQRGIQIAVTAAGPRSYVGRVSERQWPSMWLNFGFRDWSPSCQGERREFCIRAIAVHEFGHALGFYHEQDRPNTPRSCLDDLRRDDIRPRADGVPLTGWDEDSVMNYCNDEWVNGGQLSARDIVGLQRYYAP